MEISDGASLDSACGTPSEEQVNMPWSAELEEEQEPCTPLLMREFSVEGLLELGQQDEALEEVSFIPTYLVRASLLLDEVYVQ